MISLYRKLMGVGKLVIIIKVILLLTFDAQYIMEEEERRESPEESQVEGAEEGEEEEVEETNEAVSPHLSHDSVPTLPNLALSAIQRLRERASPDHNTSSDDFQPMRKKQKPNPTGDASVSDDNEVRTPHCDTPQLPWQHILGSDVLNMFRGMVQFRESQDSISKMWTPLWIHVRIYVYLHEHTHLSIFRPNIS